MQHKVYQKLKHIHHRDGDSSGLTTLKIPKHVSILETETLKTIPDDEDHWETITLPEQIEDVLLKRQEEPTSFWASEGNTVYSAPTHRRYWIQC